jgi:hypothetical protein
MLLQASCGPYDKVGEVARPTKLVGFWPRLDNYAINDDIIWWLLEWMSSQKNHTMQNLHVQYSTRIFFSTAIDAHLVVGSTTPGQYCTQFVCVLARPNPSNGWNTV